MMSLWSWNEQAKSSCEFKTKEKFNKRISPFGKITSGISMAMTNNQQKTQ